MDNCIYNCPFVCAITHFMHTNACLKIWPENSSSGEKKNQLAHIVSETEIMACLDYITAIKYLSCLLFSIESKCISRLPNNIVAWKIFLKINTETFYAAATEDADIACDATSL